MRDARAAAGMFRAINALPCAVIGRIHGAALGGGSGLAAVCDIVVATESTIFGFTETKLGILPAMISPFVLPKIGVSAARELFLTGMRFTAHRAKAIGLVHAVVPEAELDATVERYVTELLSAAPTAVAARQAAHSPGVGTHAGRGRRAHRERHRRAARLARRPGGAARVPREAQAGVGLTCEPRVR